MAHVYPTIVEHLRAITGIPTLSVVEWHPITDRLEPHPVLVANSVSIWIGTWDGSDWLTVPDQLPILGVRWWAELPHTPDGRVEEA